MKKAAQTALLTAAVFLITAQAAFAGDNGQGWIGEANDKVVTFFDSKRELTAVLMERYVEASSSGAISSSRCAQLMPAA